MVRWADPERVAEAVQAYVDDVRVRELSVSRVFWYGSWVSGVPTPSSDVDLCIVLESDDRPPRDRVPDFLPHSFPVGIDLVIFTEEELRDLAKRAPSWHRAIVSGRVM